MGYDIPVSCTHSFYVEGCSYCESTELGSSSEEDVFPSEYPNSDGDN